MGRELGRSKGTCRNDLVGVVIHICMETTQRISLFSYLYLKLVKTSCFFYYLLYFFFYKIGEQEGGIGSAEAGGDFGRGKVLGKGVGG
jgi:hypothetical protein